MRKITMVFGFLALAACEGPKPPPLFCPQPAVLEQAQTDKVFLPGRSDVAALVTEATITGVAGSCQYERKKQALLVSLQAGFTASNGPANHEADVTLPYFVSISQGDQIIQKSLYSITLSFAGNASNATAVSKPVTVELPNVPDSAGTDVLVGFQLSPAQLAAGP